MLLLLLIYLGLCVSVCLLQKYMPIILGIGFFVCWYMVCFEGKLLMGGLLLAALCFTTVLYQISKGTEPKSSQSKTQAEKNLDKGNNGNWILYLIPIFWPLIIVRLLFSTRHVPTDMSPYDYEQHLKCNRH